MPKKPLLPGAADFFTLDQPPETEQPSSPEADGVSPKPPPSAGRRSTRRRDTSSAVAPEDPPAAAAAHAAPELAPPATVPTGPTEKVTFYLHPMSLRRLELLRAQMLVERNLKVNRSQIIDLLLEETLQHPEPLTQKLLALAEPGTD